MIKDTTLEETEETLHTTSKDTATEEGAPAVTPPHFPPTAGQGPDTSSVPAAKPSGGASEASAVTEESTQARRAAPGRENRRAIYIVWIIVGAILAAIMMITSLLLARKAKVTAAGEKAATSETSAANEPLSPDQRAAISVEVVQKQTVQSGVTAPGKVTFNGNRVTPVFSQFSGRLVRLDAEVGMVVRPRQVIGTIDTPDIVSAQADYQQALTSERSARTSLDLLRRTRERAERLVAAEAIPRRDLQQAQADEARAADDLQRAQSAVAAARGRLLSAGISDDEINRLTAGVRAVNRLVPLIAPIGGTITERKAGLGQVVQAGAGDPLLMIADLSSVWVMADVYEDQIASMRVGAPVKIKTPAYPAETFAARVDQIGSTLDPDKHTVAVRCIVPNRGGRLKPGMFASLILSSSAPQTALTVPASAIITEGDQHSVYVEESPGHYVKRPVETGAETEGAVIIRSGLTEGERVVVRGGLLISGRD